MMICMIGWLLLALAAIDFRTFRRVNVLHAALSLCGSLTVRIIYPGRQLKQLAIAAPGLAGCKGGWRSPYACSAGATYSREAIPGGVAPVALLPHLQQYSLH